MYSFRGTIKAARISEKVITLITTDWSTIAGYRSAISAYHDSIDGVSIGKHPLVSSLMSGIHNKRFSQTKYIFIWDVEKVVNYLSLIDSVNYEDKELTLKLTTLLALTLST